MVISFRGSLVATPGLNRPSPGPVVCSLLIEEARKIYRRYAEEAAQMKPSTVAAVELLPAPASQSARERASGLEVAGFCAVMGLALAGRMHGRRRERRG